MKAFHMSTYRDRVEFKCPFYGEFFISIGQFITEVDKYMHWYTEKRVKVSLGGLRPLEYRRKLGIAI